MNLLKQLLLKWRDSAPASATAPVPSPRTTHEPWCDTGMPNAAYYRVRCNCDDTGPGSFRAVMEVFNDFRDADRRYQRIAGIDIGILPDAETLARENDRPR